MKKCAYAQVRAVHAIARVCRTIVSKNSTNGRNVRANIPTLSFAVKHKSRAELILPLVKNAWGYFALLKYGIS